MPAAADHAQDPHHRGQRLAAPPDEYRPAWWRRLRQSLYLHAPARPTTPGAKASLEDWAEWCWATRSPASLRALVEYPSLPPDVRAMVVGTIRTQTDVYGKMGPPGPPAWGPEDDATQAWATAAPWLAVRRHAAASDATLWLTGLLRNVPDQQDWAAAGRSVPYDTLHEDWKHLDPSMQKPWAPVVLTHPGLTDADSAVLARELAPVVLDSEDAIQIVRAALPTPERRAIMADQWLAACVQREREVPARNIERFCQDAHTEALETYVAETGAATRPYVWGEIWGEWRQRATRSADQAHVADVVRRALPWLVERVLPDRWTTLMDRWSTSDREAIRTALPDALHRIWKEGLSSKQLRQVNPLNSAPYRAHWHWAVGSEGPAWTTDESVALLDVLGYLGIRGKETVEPAVLGSLCRLVVERDDGARRLTTLFDQVLENNLDAGGTRIPTTARAALLIEAWPETITTTRYSGVWERHVAANNRACLIGPTTHPRLIAAWWPALARVNLPEAAARLAHCPPEALAQLQLSGVDALALLQLDSAEARLGAVAALQAVDPAADEQRPVPTPFRHATFPHPELPAGCAVHHPSIREWLAEQDPRYRQAMRDEVARLETERVTREAAQRATANRQKEQDLARQQREAEEARRRRAANQRRRAVATRQRRF